MKDLLVVITYKKKLGKIRSVWQVIDRLGNILADDIDTRQAANKKKDSLEKEDL